MHIRAKAIEPAMTTGHPICPCVDLKLTFGNRYRYERDPAYEAERPEWRKVEAAWLTYIPCKFGRIHPYGDRLLAAYSNAGAVKRRQLEGLACVETVLGGEGSAEVIVTFDVADMDQVADVLKVRRPRVYSPAERAKRRTRLAQVRRPRRRRKSPDTGGLLAGQER